MTLAAKEIYAGLLRLAAEHIELAREAAKRNALRDAEYYWDKHDAVMEAAKWLERNIKETT